MLRNLMMTLAYDGADFHGWQFQPDMRTVQECLEQALRRVLRHQVVVVGCSRTDAGVHAQGYVANVYTTNPGPAVGIFRATGSRLPKDMTLIHLQEVPLTLHATRSAVSKLYRYRLHNAPGRPCEQQQQRYVYHFWQPLDLDAMRQAAEHWVGTHDFTSFATAGGSVRETNVRTIHRIEVYRRGEEVRIDVEGSGFLYRQVRNMVGTLCEIGCGRRRPEDAPGILAARDRRQAGNTAPARGLCLQWVRYDLPGLPPPSPDLLLRAEQARPPAGAERAWVEDRTPSAAPRPPDLDLEEEPPA